MREHRLAQYLLAVIVCLVSLFLFNTNAYATTVIVKPKPKKVRYKVPRYSKNVMKSRLGDLNMSMDLELDKEVKHLITSYTERARSKTEKMLGRSMMYFPIYEKYIKKYNLPLELRCLSVIESGLKPKATSSVGAAGLWQFMPATGRQYGLQVNDYVDDRLNPHKATEAAMKHLSKQFDRFEDWTLAIAAYNCGSGRMRSAIKKAKSRDYNKVKKHLPKETQHYVNKFLAANYVVNYYLFYDLHPSYPDYNMSITETMVLFDYTSFSKIEEQTGIDVEILQKLNPSYKTGIIPPNSDGNYIILPRIGRKNADKKPLAVK